MRNYVKEKYFLILSIIFTFVIFLPILCQAEKPGFKAKHDQLKKEAQMNIEIFLPEYELTEEKEWMVLRCDDWDANIFFKKGEPELSSLTYFISIPEGAKVKHIELKPQGRPIELTKHIKPVPEPVIIGSPPKPPIPDEKIYNSPTPYPQEDFEYSIAKKGTTKVIVLVVYPFKYIGKSKTLIVNEYIEADISLKSDKWQPNPKPYNAVDRNFKERLVNPESAFFKEGGAQ